MVTHKQNIKRTEQFYLLTVTIFIANHLIGQNMKNYLLILTVCLFSMTLTDSAFAAEKRCGWLENPTPGNWWLTDADASWTIAAQGGYSIDDASWEKMPELGGKDYVETNGNYGYGCACLSVTVDKKNTRITKVFSGKTLPLKKCRSDKALPEMPQ